MKYNYFIYLSRWTGNLTIHFSGFFLILLSISMILPSCENQPAPLTTELSIATRTSPQLKEMVLFWNEKSSELLDFHTNPGDDSRRMAIIHIAIHDALNTIENQFDRYALTDPINTDASPEAALCSAARSALDWAIDDVRDFIVGSNQSAIFLSNFGGQYSTMDQWASAQHTNVQDWYDTQFPAAGPGVAEGNAIGLNAFAAIHTLRSADGRSNVALISSNPPDGTSAGVFAGSFYAFPPPPNNKFLSNWGEEVLPFVTQNNYDFRRNGPYQFDSHKYSLDYNEVKEKGVAGPTSTRNAEENALAENCTPSLKQHIFWNTFTADIIASKPISGCEAARFLALVHTAMADGASAMFLDLYHFRHWRPITAIRYPDGWNDETSQDLSWTPHSPIPRVPEYPSVFGIFGGIMAEIVPDLFPNDDVLKNQVKKAAEDNAFGKIYCGWNFRQSAEDGLVQGKRIGKYVLGHAFEP